MKLKKTKSLKLKTTVLLAWLFAGLLAHPANADGNENPPSTVDTSELDVADAYKTLGVLYEELDARKKAVEGGYHSLDEYNLFKSVLERKKEELFEKTLKLGEPDRRMSQEEIEAISNSCESIAIAGSGIDIAATTISSNYQESDTGENLPLPKLAMLINVVVTKVSKADGSTEFVDIDPCNPSIELDYRNYDYYVLAGSNSYAMLIFPTSDGENITKNLELTPGDLATHVNPELYETWICYGTEFTAEQHMMVVKGTFFALGNGQYSFYNEEGTRGFRQHYTFESKGRGGAMLSDNKVPTAEGFSVQVGATNSVVASRKSFLIGTSFDEIAVSYEGDFNAINVGASVWIIGFAKGIFAGGGWEGHYTSFSLGLSVGPGFFGAFVTNFTIDENRERYFEFGPN